MFSAPLLFTGGTVYSGVAAGTPDAADHTADAADQTVDAADHWAVAVLDGVIIAVDQAALDWAQDPGSPTEVEVIDLAGGFLMPAFGDGHAHPLLGGLEAVGPQIRPCASVAEIVAEVGRWAADNPDASWIFGASYDSSLSPGGVFDARWLDEAVADRPVVLRGWDYHTLWCNTRALELAGIETATPEPDLGEIVRRPDGSPCGTLREWGAVDLVLNVAPAISSQTRVEALCRATEHGARHGITWIQDAWVEPADVPIYLEAAARGLLSTRINLALRADPRCWPDQLPEFIRLRELVNTSHSGLLTLNTVKFFADGVVENATAALLEPYLGEPGNTGMLIWSAKALAEAVSQVDAAGFQPHIHAIGDAAVRIGLDAVAAADRCNGPRDRRAVLAHVQLIDPADVARFAELGVIANAEPLWAQLDSLMCVLTEPRLGPDRSRLQYPLASLLASRTGLSFGSDWPVSEINPLRGIATAVTRMTAAGDPAGGWVPDERLSVPAALSAYTRGVAHQAFADNTGVIAPAAVADLVWLSGDPRTIENPLEIAHLEVLGTWLNGRLTYSRTP